MIDYFISLTYTLTVEIIPIHNTGLFFFIYLVVLHFNSIYNK